MTTTAIPPAHTPSAPVTLWDRVAVVTLGVIGFVLSYDALRQMAVAIHVRGPLTYLFPLIIDGFIAYGVRALLVLRDAPRPARAYAWFLFAGATAASVWANALHAVRLNHPPTPDGHLPSPDGGLRLGDGVVGFLSTLAPLALAGAVHLYILIARHAPATASRTGGPDGVGPHRERSADPAPPVRGEHAEAGREADPDDSDPLPQRSDADPVRTAWTGAEPVPESAEVADWAAGSADRLTDDQAEAALLPDADEAGAATAGGKPVGRPPGASMERLLEVSRPAVAAHGRPSRPVVERAVREAGLQLGSTRLTLLMDELRKEHSDQQARWHPTLD